MITYELSPYHLKKLHVLANREPGKPIGWA